MKGDAKRLIRELQTAIDANGGDDVFVGFVSMDEDEAYGYEEYVSMYTSSKSFDGVPIAIIKHG